jgi:acetyl esterase
MEATLRFEELIQRYVLRALLALPHRAKLWLSRKPRVRIDGDELDPELHLILSLRQMKGLKGLCDLPPLEQREQMRRDGLIHARRKIRVGEVRDFEIAGPAGPLTVRHYAPAGARGGATRPLVVFYHGGGFVLGDLESHDAPCRLVCQRAGVHVLAVAYRLAPEHPFPAGIEDALEAYRWAVRHASELGSDPRRVIVAGDSAGGNLATVVARLAREAREPAPALQFLIYPVVARDDDFVSRESFKEGFLLTASDIQVFRDHYLGGHERIARLDPEDPRLAPLLAKDLQGLAPAVIVTAAFDPLRDEGEAYARALERAGVACRLRRQPGMIHGFANLIGISPSCRRAFEAAVDEFSRELLALS